MQTTGPSQSLSLRGLVLSALLASVPMLGCQDDNADGADETAGPATLQILSQVNGGSTPVKGPNELMISIKDQTGTPVLGAEVEVTPFMSIHGHGSPEHPHVSEVGQGQYRAENVVLHMAGPWEIGILAVFGDEYGELELQVDVPG